jgi:hypothetical protein
MEIDHVDPLSLLDNADLACSFLAVPGATGTFIGWLRGACHTYALKKPKIQTKN